MMHRLISLLVLTIMTTAEPPVGHGYPAAWSSTDQQLDDHLSQEYVPPSPLSGSLSTHSDSLSPNSGYSSTRTTPSSRTYSPPTSLVSFSQRFSSASSRSLKNLAAVLKSLSQNYVPSARNSPEYNAPEARSLSQDYGVPSITARTLSTEYGMPDAKSIPSFEYGVPKLRSNQKSLKSSSRKVSSSRSSHKYSLPLMRTPIDSMDQGSIFYTAKSKDVYKTQGYDQTLSPDSDATSYNSPSFSYPSSHDAPTENFDAYLHERNSISENYGVPGKQDLTTKDSKDAVNSEGYNKKSVDVSRQTALNTEALASSYTSSRSTPSPTYLPSSSPSQEYGVSDDYDTRAKARAFEELLNQNPANYEFSYQISDQEYGGDFGHSETRLADRAEGSYYVVLPDGTKQTVEYTADEGGFKPKVSMEPVQGYAATRSNGGPY